MIKEVFGILKRLIFVIMKDCFLLRIYNGDFQEFMFKYNSIQHYPSLINNLSGKDSVEILEMTSDTVCRDLKHINQRHSVTIKLNLFLL